MRRRLKGGDVEGRLLVVGRGHGRDRGLGRLERGERLTRIAGPPQPPRSRPASVAGGVVAVVMAGDERDLRVVGGWEQPTTAEGIERRAIVAGEEESCVRTHDQ